MDVMLKDRALAPEGRAKVEFAAGRMPVLRAVTAELEATRPLQGLRVAACLHVTTETANLCRALVAGGTEVTSAGVQRLRNMAREGALRWPMLSLNDALTKHLFDNRYGTGQNTVDGILRATNVLLAGSVLVVAGYGWCGRGVAQRARG